MVPTLLYYDSGDDPTRRKSTLFCWECDYTSPHENGWDVRTNGRYVQRVCPRCDTVLTEQPRTETVPALRRRPAEHAASAWRHLFRTSAELWRMPFTVGAAGTTAAVDYFDRN
ncbi:hypothetical protein [Natronobacterium texcoconense]|uniref:DUF8106 domain-containing protein n=1 Tax=Natronobacterium texcoconense TaxID=1095778 RepID=A0A1H1GTC1_NATTX|nr:hypothetical protein [Natronobacterium texcoconense]SDR16096.1 hypothetical protein SAMN04489842_2582 [Natronobacterium texcoconense]